MGKTLYQEIFKHVVHDLDKKANEIVNIIITKSPRIRGPIAWEFEVTIQTKWVRYVRVGGMRLNEDRTFKFVQKNRRTRLTVPVSEVPVGGQIYLVNPSCVVPLAWIVKEQHSLTTRIVSSEDAPIAGWLENVNDVEATCYLSNEGLHLAEILVATLDEIRETGKDPAEMANGCKFDTWKWGIRFFQAKQKEHNGRIDQKVADDLYTMYDDLRHGG